MDIPTRLIDPSHELFLWNEESQKWQDRGNDFFCARRHDGKWRVSARYGFEDGRRDIEFDKEHEALQFFMNYLFSRHMRLIEKASPTRAA